MQGQNQQQAYDRGITIFSPDGRLYQVEYAREAVKRGTASIGVRTPEGVVLVVDKQTRSPLLEGSSVEKLHKIDDHVGAASAGHVADARQLVDFARQQSQVERVRYDEPIGVRTLTKSVTDHIQQYTQVGGARPFGVALLIAGVEGGEPRLFETDPSGTSNEWKAVAIGSNRGDIQEFLEDEYDADLSVDDGIDLALRALNEGREDALSGDGVGVGIVDADTGTYRELAADESQSYIDDIEDAADDSDDDDDEE
ncbi:MULTISPECIES: archaeal proteasome endopeptidase complex subunit alpha [Halobacterium]|uniref:archaeal proteasome endopeptidase complex subunit alpha n=1 Tax=Halobacterium TaxID=2239 RepID=UPI0019665B26|nr:MULTISPECIES: archaeal proteasome endopeptidase complex subunit alpha [Halobacterium]MCF2206094.1 archaeal proteasome endopeptidase complex subunit alpha [Halobacterium salinarum]MDL0129487.1 archaeal proteasome endopeptidase complex subunit alpha [Halobacterium salinarum]MDL0140486.1 archaeal proteasome endopeptidase complex subunit alpha [Halobacterium salinarum]MDL0143236.1 archaeal proteasome endopeptidase complex subunit alpha [Halobacterium salinarum]MDL0145256.1 archaeal proteasome e